MDFKTEKCFVDVILPFNLPRLYTYCVPNEMVRDIGIGKRVIVQFGLKKFYTGIIKNIHFTKPAEYEVKEIISIPDDHPLVNNIQLNFWEWISEYYICTLGDVYKAGLPSGFKLESESYVILNRNFSDFGKIEENEGFLLNILQKRNYLTIKEINNIFHYDRSFPVINSLVEKGAVNIEQKIIETYKPKVELYVRLVSGLETEEKLRVKSGKIKTLGEADRYFYELYFIVKYHKRTC